jgi:hypothetical protein
MTTTHVAVKRLIRDVEGVSHKLFTDNFFSPGLSDLHTSYQLLCNHYEEMHRKENMTIKH